MTVQLPEAPPRASSRWTAVRRPSGSPRWAAARSPPRPAIRSTSSSSRTSPAGTAPSGPSANVDHQHRQAADHGAHRAVWLRQVDAHPDDEPDERPRPELPERGPDPLRGPGPVRARAWTRSPSAAASGWSSRSRTRSRRASTRTWRSARGSTASGATWTSSSSARLRRAALWDDVKDKLNQSGMALSGGQQQRLCIARTIAVEPEVILMDEPCSALDPRSTLQIEELMAELKRDYTIVIVTHNMQQAARASDTTIFMTMGDDRAGYVVERGRHDADLHEPEGPLDRGLRVRPVRLSEETAMDDQQSLANHEPSGVRLADGDRGKGRPPRRPRPTERGRAHAARPANPRPRGADGQGWRSSGWARSSSRRFAAASGRSSTVTSGRRT